MANMNPSENPYGFYKLSEKRCDVCNEVIEEIWRSPTVQGDSFISQGCDCSKKHIAIMKYGQLTRMIRELNVSDGIYTLSEYGQVEVSDKKLKSINGISLEMPLRPSQEAIDLVRKSYEKYFGISLKDG